MIGPIIIGFLAAAIVALPARFGGFLESSFPGFVLAAPVFVLAVTGIAMLLQRFVLDQRPGTRSYDGLADLFIHIHSIAKPDSALRWAIRGLNSLLLSFFGGTVGPEGAATEFAHSFALKTRSRSSSRFEQRRRSDAAAALSAGISAAFGSPFAAMLVPIELGIGGPLIPAAVAALAAFVGVKYVFPSGALAPSGFVNLGAILNGSPLSWVQWAGVLVIAATAGIAGAVLTRFIRYVQDNLLELFQTQAWMRTLTAGVLLFFLILIYRPGHTFPLLGLERVLWGHLPAGELGVLFFTQCFGLALVLAGFGTVGLFWPLFVIGGIFGVGVDQWLFQGIPSFGAIAGLAGSAAFWGAMLGAPLAAAVLIFEITSSIPAFLIAIVAAYLARFVVRFLKTPPLIDRDLEARGMALIDGRSASILDSILIRDAMMTDYETVHEHEPVSEIYSRLLKSRYPFLPVVTAQCVYKGLLTVDMVQEAWHAQEAAVLKNSAKSSLVRLLEAKDLLYRSGFKAPVAKVSDRLSKTSGLFEDTPCIPVLAEDGHIAGLLFVYNVRLAYDREVARRSLSVENREL